MDEERDTKPTPNPTPNPAPNPTQNSTAPIAVVMVAGPNGGRARRWLYLGYDFAPCCPTEVSAADAKRLLAGGPGIDGRVFARADSPEGAAALKSAHPKARW